MGMVFFSKIALSGAPAQSRPLLQKRMCRLSHSSHLYCSNSEHVGLSQRLRGSKKDSRRDCSEESDHRWQVSEARLNSIMYGNSRHRTERQGGAILHQLPSRANHNKVMSIRNSLTHIVCNTNKRKLCLSNSGTACTLLTVHSVPILATGNTTHYTAPARGWH